MWLYQMPFAGTGDITEVPAQWGVHEDVYCAVSHPFFQQRSGTALDRIAHKWKLFSEGCM